ncbi:MAG: ABC transporter permease [Agathobacter sp.]|uniref:ABC transporter permease n=1 Tax=Agathobacter sp. TaxID=2021311 RepID=UPI003996C42D
MKSKKIKNPLIKRIPKELAGDWKKYLVVFLFLVLTIGFVSGMYVANESMLTAADEGITRYKQEDGHFELKEKADSSLIEAIESGEKADIPGLAEENTADGDNDDSEENGKSNDDLDNSKKTSVTVYENFFRNEDEDNDNDGKSDGTIRVYAKTDDINLACLLDGDFPQNENEIAVDRMHADNAGMKVGDKISVSGKEFKITGLIAYVNYSTLHEKKTDLIFDAIKFDVAMVTQEGFDRLDKSIHYSYAWKYDHAPADDIEEKEQSDSFMEAMVTQVMLAGNDMEDYTPKYGNPAINFATDDMGSDKAMGGMLLDILVVIIAFIFAVTISNTIANESSAIGTLRALGYTKGELVCHYLSMPVIVTLLAAIVGNILGYTVFKNVVVSMYYNSYSLPVYKTIWNPDAFLKTTVLPVIIMLVVNLIVIVRMMQHTPLQFLRHDMKKNKSKKAMRLPRWNFMSRFRLRIMFQNKANYLILFVGILFIMEMLAMAVGMPDTLDYYKSNTDGMMFAKYQYVLKSYVDEEGNIVSTGNKDAEKFDMTSLLKKSDALDEEVSIYGIADNSSYVKINDFDSLKKNEVYISDSFSQKYGLNEGDEVKLDAQYEKKTYTFKVKGIYDKSQSIAVFMPIDKFADIFDLKDDQFSGFLSDTKIKDIDENNIATTITIHDITKMADQLDHSMGSYMSYFQVLCILLAAVMIYLLTKLIIEKNETAISMTKILGYENKEIASLYLVSTSIVVVLADLISVVIGTLVMKVAWKMMLFSYSGWFAFKVKPLGYVKMFAFVLIGYLIVMVFDFKRIKKIPMDQALKNVE